MPSPSPEQEDPNDTPQVGGNHYRQDGKATYQHWDFCVDADLGYLEGNATKYLGRHAEKNGFQDLMKAWHYVMKIASCASTRGLRQPPSAEQSSQLRRIAVEQYLQSLPEDRYSKERELTKEIVYWQSEHGLRITALKIRQLAEARYPEGDGSGATPAYVAQ